MRNPVVFLVLLAALGLVACEQQVDVAAEEEAIKAVIQKQLDAVRTASYEGEAAVWANEPYIVIRKSGRKIVGWDSLSVYYKKTFEERRDEPDKYRIEEFTGSNYDIHLHGNAAYVLYDEHVKGVWEGEDVSDDYKVAKYLEKMHGEWKIVAVF
ncbi:MAG: hypothetical protein GH143_02790 [Calditrichaeota bacterium]|nr:hypothetical protein [Calditrichota bacterium]